MERLTVGKHTGTQRDAHRNKGSCAFSDSEQGGELCKTHLQRTQSREGRLGKQRNGGQTVFAVKDGETWESHSRSEGIGMRVQRQPAVDVGVFSNAGRDLGLWPTHWSGLWMFLKWIVFRNM